MKTTNLLSVFLMVTILFLSCSKDDEGSDKTNDNDDDNESYFKPTDSNSLIAYYQFNNNLNDDSNNNLNGTATNPYYGENRDNESNSSYVLNGTTDRVIETDDFLLSSGSFSISFWMYIDDSVYESENEGVGRYVFGTREVCSVGQFFNIIYTHSLSDGRKKRISAEIRDTNTGEFSVGAEDFLTDEWVHVVFTVDDENKESKIYFNNELKNTSTWSDLSIDVSNTAPLIIGTNVCVGVNGSGNIIGTSIDDLAVFSNVLTADEIADLASN